MNGIRQNGDSYPDTRYTSVFLQENHDDNVKKKDGKFNNLGIGRY